MSYHQETAVKIEKDIVELNSFKKFDQFINLCLFSHLNWCEKDNDCVNCNFIVRNVYVENLSDNVNGVGSLQNYCRKYFGSFFSLRTFSKSLNAVGKEKIKLEKKINDVLRIWNAKNIQIWIKRNLTGNFQLKSRFFFFFLLNN